MSFQSLCSAIVVGLAISAAIPSAGAIPQETAPARPLVHPISTLTSKGQTLPGAEVLFLVEAELSAGQLGRAGLTGADSMTQLAFFGRSLISDETGRVELPAWSRGVCVVLVRKGNLCDMRNLREPAAIGTEVKVRDRGTQLVDLRDAEGRSLPGSAVCVREVLGGQSVLLRAAPCNGPGGRGQLDLLDSLNFRIEAGAELVIEPFGHFAAVNRVPLVIEEINAAPLSLTCPEFGSVELELLHQDGSVPCGRLEVEVRVTAEGGSPPTTYLTDDGKLTLERVGLGVPLEIIARRPGGREGGRLTVKGPATAGGREAHKLEFEEFELVLVGRFVDAGGAPLYRRTFHGVAKARNVFFRREFEFDFVTEPDGGFQLLLPLDEKIPLAEASVQVDQLDTNDRPIGRFVWKLEQELSAECVDLGAVTLTPL